jgi:hypothetical protein
MDYKNMVLKNQIQHIEDEHRLSGGFLGTLGMMVIPSLISKIIGRGVQPSIKAYKPKDIEAEVARTRQLVDKSQMTGTNLTGSGRSGGINAIIGGQAPLISDIDTMFGKGRSGGGILSSLGIPVVSDIAGMFGLGRSGGQTLKLDKVECLKGKGKSGGRRSGGKKPANPWVQLVNKVRKEQGFKTIKEAIKYIKDNNLY